MKVGLISDTHIPYRARHLPKEIFTLFSQVDLILHAGDLLELSVIGDLSVLAPVEAVAGNVDSFEVRAKLPRRRLLQLEDAAVGLIHGDGSGYDTPGRALRAFPDADCVVFGHSHRPMIEIRGGKLLVNPGSACDPRTMPEPTVGFLYIEADGMRAEIVGLHSGQVTQGPWHKYGG
ncbi:MAG: metallophosphoesterase family protein [Firmicutes bacterium]|nr:metallophosphoesterase family protein [Bacillota bacterium]